MKKQKRVVEPVVAGVGVAVFTDEQVRADAHRVGGRAVFDDEDVSCAVVAASHLRRYRQGWAVPLCVEQLEVSGVVIVSTSRVRWESSR